MSGLWHNGRMRKRGELSDPGPLMPFVEEEFRRSDERLEPLLRKREEQRRRSAAQMAEQKAAFDAEREESRAFRAALRAWIDDPSSANMARLKRFRGAASD